MTPNVVASQGAPSRTERSQNTPTRPRPPGGGSSNHTPCWRRTESGSSATVLVLVGKQLFEPQLLDTHPEPLLGERFRSCHQARRNPVVGQDVFVPELRHP